MSSPEPSRQQVRILVVDDESRVKKDMVRILKRKGYIAIAPEGAGHSLVENTMQAARSFRPHVAIVDISLDGNEANRGGITLLEELKSAWCILYSGKLSIKLTREIQRKYPRVTWIEKDDKTQILLELIAEKASEVSASERNRFITMTPGWSENTLKALLGKDTSAPAGLVDDILAQLFPDSSRVELESLDQSIVTLQSVSRGHSAVTKVYHDGKFEPQLVKLAPADAIEREAANYRKHIEGNLGGRFNAQLVRNVLFWDLGGVLYNFLDQAGPKLVTFHEHYDKSLDPASILAPLRHFYLGTWRNFYDHPSPGPDDERLGDYYYRIFKLNERMTSFANQEEQNLIPGIDMPLLNPVQWLSRHMQQSFLVSYRLAITHGDLHSDNLFVDDEHAWVIDFERTGPGHILRDFIEMEVDIFTRLGPGNIGEEVNKDLLVAGLILANELNFNLDPDLCRHITHPSINKALDVIREHRKICAEIAHPSDFREYLWGLLFDLVYLVTHIIQDKTQQERALLLGGIICERLKRGNKWSAKDLLEAATVSTPISAPDPKPADTGGKTVFISYAHADQKWLKKVQTNLLALNLLGLKFTLWDDTKIKAGAKWREEIENALTESKVAILLVSTDFMASKFIQEKELPPLLKAAATEGTTILPLILRPCLFTSHSELSAYQAVNDPAKPLSKLPPPDQDEILVKLAEKIRDLIR
jgi:FixJ family two-component response regulator